MQTMLEKIKNITEGLEAMQAEISSQLSPDPVAQVNPIFGDTDGMDVLTNFKSAIDKLRTVLWMYIEDLSGRVDEDKAQKTRHLLRATEMLRALSQNSQLSDSESCYQSGSFFEHLHTIVDSFIDDHRSSDGPNRKKPA